MPKNSRHVTNRGNSWAVVNPGSSRASALLDTQEEAIQRAKEIVKNEGGGSVIIHRKNNQIREERSFNNESPNKG